jgi:hypothetical protein
MAGSGKLALAAIEDIDEGDIARACAAPKLVRRDCIRVAI